VYEFISLFSTWLLLNYFEDRIRKWKFKKGYKEKAIDKILTTKHKNRFKKFSIFFSILFSVVTVYFINEGWIYISAFIPFIFIKVYVVLITETKSELDIKKITNWFIPIFFILSVFCFALWGYMDGGSSKEKREFDKITSFADGKLSYSTDGLAYNLIGETSGYIFIYDIKLKKSLIFNKMIIKDLSIVDPEVKSNKRQEELNKKVKIFMDDFFNINDSTHNKKHLP